jgi:nitroreductase/NAD-dependent dihydropyrimidine dehydrogenase PreA subunit
MITIDEQTCTVCGRCVVSCPAMVYRREEERVLVAHPDWCIGCAHCVLVCPVGAIEHRGLPEEEGVLADVRPAGAEELLAAIRARRSVRRFRPTPLSREDVLEILQAGRFSPTGSNSQNVCYAVVLDPGKMKEVRELTYGFYTRLMGLLDNPVGHRVLGVVLDRRLARSLVDDLPKAREAMRRRGAGEDRLFYDAPALIAAHAPSWDTSSAFNCCAALYAVSIVAHARGIGCCFNGYFVAAAARSRAIRRALAVPPGNRVYAAMLLGHAAEEFRGVAPRRPPQVDWL